MGMPAFNQIFKRLLTHDEVGKVIVLLLSEKKVKLNTPSIYDEKLKAFHVTGIGNNNGGLARNAKVSHIVMLIKAFFYSIFLILKYRIGVIYGNGNHGFISGVVSIFTGKPNVRRLYGVSLLSKSKHLSNWRIFLRHPFIYLSIVLPARTLIITNDGSHGDFYQKKFGNKRNKFVFELNGVDPVNERTLTPPNFSLPDKFFSYIGRICEFKRQLLLLDILYELKKENILIPTLIVGQVSEEDYYEKVKKKVKDLDLQDLVTFTGGVSSSEVYYIISKSYLTFSVYHTSNLGNVFLEAMTIGTPMVAINCNNSLDYFPNETYFQSKTDKPKKLMELVKTAYKNEEKRNVVAKNAKTFAIEKFRTWSENSEYTLNELLR